jgi:hypothetical protein
MENMGERKRCVSVRERECEWERKECVFVETHTYKKESGAAIFTRFRECEKHALW